MEFKTGELARVLSMCAEASALPDGVGQTALFFAVQRANDQEARQVSESLVREAGIDPRRKDFGGQSPVFYAAASGNVECLRWLVDVENCDANEKDGLNQSPLFYAAREGKDEVVKYLLTERKVNPNEYDRNGQTPLFYAAREGKELVCRCLLDAGASPAHRDLTGRRPVYFAKLNNHAAVSDMLAVGPDDEQHRKRYRLVFLGPQGTQLTPTSEQLTWLEEKHPDLCIWSTAAPIATSLVLPPTSKATPSVPKRTSVTATTKPTKTAGIPAPIWMTAARQIVSELFKKEDAWIFVRPVDPVRDQCLDYLKVITQPMDFGTIRKKMSKYQSKSEFLADAELVFANCRIYNKPGTLPDILCQRVYAFYNQLIEQSCFTQIPDSPKRP